MEKHTPGKHEGALQGAWHAGPDNPYGPLNLKRYRLQRVGDLALRLMEEHLDMQTLRVNATIAPGIMQNAYDRHLKIAARMLDGAGSSYEELYREELHESLSRP